MLEVSSENSAEMDVGQITGNNEIGVNISHMTVKVTYYKENRKFVYLKICVCVFLRKK